MRATVMTLVAILALPACYRPVGNAAVETAAKIALAPLDTGATMRASQERMRTLGLDVVRDVGVTDASNRWPQFPFMGQWFGPGMYGGSYYGFQPDGWKPWCDPVRAGGCSAEAGYSKFYKYYPRGVRKP